MTTTTTRTRPPRASSIEAAVKIGGGIEQHGGASSSKASRRDETTSSRVRQCSAGSSSHAIASDASPSAGESASFKPKQRSGGYTKAGAEKQRVASASSFFAGLQQRQQNE